MPTALSSVVAPLLRLAVMPKDDWDAALQQLLEVACDLLDVERVNYWSLCDEPPSLVCELGYVCSKKRFERGIVLRESECKEYLDEIRRVQLLLIDDVGSDPRVDCMRSYLVSHKIGALLDVPVLAQGRLVGDLCHEHVGGSRRWTERDAELAMTLSHSLSSLLEVRARSDAEKSERRSAFLAQTSTLLAETLDPGRAAEIVVQRTIPTLGDMASLIGFDGQRAWRITHMHADPQAKQVLDEVCSRFGGDIEGPGFGVEALRQGQSLLMPCCDQMALRAFGLEQANIELYERLRIRSAMSVLMRVRAQVTGVLSIASCSRSYDRDDLRFAEAYADQVAALLENVSLLAKAHEAIRARDDFLLLAGHELRTPLTSLNIAVELLKKGLGPAQPPVQRALDTIGRQATRLARLTELIVLAARHEAGTLPLRRERLDLAALAREVVRDFEDMAKRAGCELRVAADEPVEIQGDPVGLEVVVSNLLGNAVKFGAGAPIEVVARGTEQAAELMIRDHGIGISEHQLGSVFGRFERAVSSQNFGGLGLGLYISSQLVESHGGTIRAESRPGGGACFTVVLPRG